MDVSDYLQHLICFCIRCSCYTAAISRTSLPQRLLYHLPSNPSNIFVLPPGRISPSLTDASRLHFVQASLVLPSLNSISNCLCGCNARLPPRTYSISHPLGVFVLPFRPPASWIPLHWLARRLNRLGNYRRRLLPHSGPSEVIPISRAYIA